jgi:hypothetical protein
MRTGFSVSTAAFYTATASRTSSTFHAYCALHGSPSTVQQPSCLDVLYPCSASRFSMLQALLQLQQPRLHSLAVHATLECR